MDFFLFCLLNAVLFIRPAELVPALLGLPIYQFVLLATVAAAYPSMVAKLQVSDLLANPINFCVLGLVIAVPLSHLRHVDFFSARYSFMAFGKSALYYLLFIAVIRSEERLDRFFKILLLLIGVMAALSLLHYHGYIYLPQLDAYQQRSVDAETGELDILLRLRSTGIFNDPNDFAMILVVGLVLGAQYLLAGDIVARPVLLLLMSTLGYALFLTKSRGGFLALVAAMGAFAYARWGWRRAAMVGVLLLPIVGAVFAMRGDNAMESGTGQSRIQLWAEGFGLWKSSLTFGIGYGMYADEVGHVAHNSFVHCYVELGLLGGTMFFGCFYFAFRTLWSQLRVAETVEDDVASRRTSLMLSILCGAATSMCSLSRAYGVPAYLIIGLSSVTVQLNGQFEPLKLPRVDYPTMRKLAIASVLFLVATYVYMKTMVRWG